MEANNRRDFLKKAALAGIDVLLDEPDQIGKRIRKGLV